MYVRWMMILRAYFYEDNYEDNDIALSRHVSLFLTLISSIRLCVGLLDLHFKDNLMAV